MLVVLFKKFLKTVRRGLQRSSIQFGHYIFHNVLNILKLLSFGGSFHHRLEKKICWCKIIKIGWVAYLHSIVFGQKYCHYQRGMGKSIIMQQEPTALYSKLWPELGSSPDSVESTINCALQTQTVYESQLVCQKMVLILDFYKWNVLGLGNDFEVHHML